MKTITKYQANDGSEWNDADKAAARDQLIIDAEKAVSVLVPVPDDIEFSNGRGFVQQTASNVLTARENLYKLANREGYLKWYIDSQKERHGMTDEKLVSIDFGWFCRMLDGSHEPLDAGMRRICRIDGQHREWGQQYYANHPEEGEQIEIA